MGFAEEMQNLGEKLLSSCNVRIDGTKSMLNGFNNDHRQMAREQKSNLREFTNNLSSDTTKMRRRFRKEHGEMSEAQSENLEAFTNGLSRNVKGMLTKFDKAQKDLHNMFAQAHKNFFKCMKEIERKKGHSTRSIREDAEPHAPKKASGQKKKKTSH